MARYLVNRAGVVHSVNDEDFLAHRERLAVMPNAETGEEGYMPREATPEEIVAFWAAQGLAYDAASDTAIPAAEAKAAGKSGK